ncbi:hypothetical protein BJ508DRAFT_416476 [Ascobolus immersus RN42]|uniref:Small ribosomal subunit protein mS35 mitochondrial conserved domain-containing protein n=1 Tax=Ascobolus immersus RN42 TaxID=1160509 RepID=A0A3N4I1P5_ASCIM|nr:hypothetical protein BJ508DRAFT_416476 [Ascobolus immersus RN42]
MASATRALLRCATRATPLTVASQSTRSATTVPVRAFSNSRTLREEEEDEGDHHKKNIKNLKAQVKRWEQKYKLDISEGKEEEEELDFDAADPYEHIPSLGHGYIEQERETRHYLRLAAYEMPLLAKLAKPFVPPKEGEVLRFRYTSYQGEDHPAQHKVVLQVSPFDLDLTEAQRIKMIKLAGSRYNPDTRIMKFNCEMFNTQAQNKRFLADQLDKLIAESKKSEDTFEDIPVDVRHVSRKQQKKNKRVSGMPPASYGWTMTPYRKEALARFREEKFAKQTPALDANILAELEAATLAEATDATKQPTA